MTHQDFFMALKRGEIATVYLFQGEEEHTKAKALEALEQKLLPQGLEAFNETTLQNPGAGAVIEASLMLPVMSERRLVVVRESGLLLPGKAANETEDTEKLLEYLDSPMETTCLVFYVKGMSDARKKLVQALKKKAVVQFDWLEDAELFKWMQAQVRPKRLSQSDASLLAFTVGSTLLPLSQELSKLKAYVGDREDITKDDIEAVATPSLECTVFQLVDALVEGKEAKAFALLSVMLEKGEARIRILAMIARQYRNLLQLVMLRQEKIPENQIQTRIGVPPFALRKLSQQAHGEDAQSLRRKLDVCVDTDFAIKSGKMREDIALDRAILTLCGGRECSA